jgi:hypothetical protein
LCIKLFHARLLFKFLMVKNKKPFAHNRDEELSPRYHPVCQQQLAGHFGLQ